MSMDAKTDARAVRPRHRERPCQDADSMSMAVMTGAALLCYAANLYLLRPGSPRG